MLEVTPGRQAGQGMHMRALRALSYERSMLSRTFQMHPPCSPLPPSRITYVEHIYIYIIYCVFICVCVCVCVCVSISISLSLSLSLYVHNGVERERGTELRGTQRGTEIRGTQTRCRRPPHEQRRTNQTNHLRRTNHPKTVLSCISRPHPHPLCPRHLRARAQLRARL